MVLFACSYGFQRTNFWPSHFRHFLIQTGTVQSKICINVELHYCILLVHNKLFSDRALDRELPPTKLPLNYATLQCGNGWKGWKQSESVEGCTCSHMIQLCNVSSDDKPSRWRVILHKLHVFLITKFSHCITWNWYFESKWRKLPHIQALNSTPIQR